MGLQICGIPISGRGVPDNYETLVDAAFADGISVYAQVLVIAMMDFRPMMSGTTGVPFLFGVRSGTEMAVLSGPMIRHQSPFWYRVA